MQLISLTRLCAVCLIAATAQGATIVWDAPTIITGDNDVSTIGTLDRAYAFGHQPGNINNFADVVNGVTFTAFNGASATDGSTTLAGTLYDTWPNEGSFSAPYSLLSGAYGALLSGAAQSDTGFNSQLTLTLGGLVVGETYLVQFWINHSSAYPPDIPAIRSTTATAGTSAVLLHNTTNTDGGLGEFVTGTFTADSTSETITFTGASYFIGPDFTFATQLNAMQLRVVPEPGAAVLFATGAAAMLLVRRSRRSS